MKKDECGAIFFLVLGIVFLILSFNYDPGTMEKPQAGLFPIMIGCSMVLFSSFVLLSSLKNRAKKDNLSTIWNELDIKNVRSAAMVLVCVSVYLVILDPVGFLLSSPPLLFILTWIMGGKNLIVNSIIGVVTSVVIYWLFWIIMRVPIPLGTILSK